MGYPLMDIECVQAEHEGETRVRFQDRLNPGNWPKELVIPAHYLLAGCRLHIECPECSYCQRPMLAAEDGKCPCGKHDWVEWIALRYSTFGPILAQLQMLDEKAAAEAKERMSAGQGGEGAAPDAGPDGP